MTGISHVFFCITFTMPITMHNSMKKSKRNPKGFRKKLPFMTPASTAMIKSISPCFMCAVTNLLRFCTNSRINTSGGR